MMYFQGRVGKVNFTNAELDANRKGYMLPSQKTRLHHDAERRFVLLMVAVVVMVISSLFAIYLIVSQNVSAVIFGACLLGLHLWMMYQAFGSYQQTRVDKSDVLMTEGKIRLSLKYGLPFDSLGGVLHINRLKFDVSPEILLTLWNACHYSVYYDPNTRQLLSFERILTKNTDETDVNLGKRFHFNVETLAANRNGQITPMQRIRVYLNMGRTFILFFAMVFPLWLPIVYVALINPATISPILLIVALFLLAGIVLMGVVDEADGKPFANLVLSTEGTARWGLFSKYDSGLVIGEVAFKMSRKDYLLFHDRRRYRVYYARQGKFILSVEHLET